MGLPASYFHNSLPLEASKRGQPSLCVRPWFIFCVPAEEERTAFLFHVLEIGAVVPLRIWVHQSVAGTNRALSIGLYEEPFHSCPPRTPGQIRTKFVPIFPSAFSLVCERNLIKHLASVAIEQAEQAILAG